MAVKKKTLQQLKAEAIQNGMSEEAFKQRVAELLDENENMPPVAAAEKVVLESLRSQKDHTTLIELILKHRLTVADLKHMLELAEKESWFQKKPDIANLNTKAFRDTFADKAVVRRRENLYVDNVNSPTKGFFRQGQARWPEWLQKLFVKKLIKLSRPSRPGDKGDALLQIPPSKWEALLQMKSNEWEVLLQMPPKQLSEEAKFAKIAIDEVAKGFSKSTAKMTEAQVESLLSAGRE